VGVVHGASLRLAAQKTAILCALESSRFTYVHFVLESARLKTASKACPETLCKPANSPPCMAAAQKHCASAQSHSTNQVDLASKRVPCLCEPIRAAGFGACGHWGSGNVLSESAGRVCTLTPQWPFATKLPRGGRRPARRGMAHVLAQGDQLKQAKHRSSATEKIGSQQSSQ
jgi:hypothetical protein